MRFQYPKIVQYRPYYLPLNVFTASKGTNVYILFQDEGRPGITEKNNKTHTLGMFVFYFERDVTSILSENNMSLIFKMYEHKYVADVGAVLYMSYIFSD